MTGMTSDVRFPSLIPLAQRPTPIQKLDHLSRNLGREIWVKRDDLTGVGLSGNKIRKLEFLLRAAQDEGADTLVTCGGAQSNHCRATALAGARLGMRTQVLLRGSAETAREGNLLLMDLAGAKVRWCSEEDYARRDEIMEEMAASIRSDGGRPYVIPEGGSSALGAIGYVLAMHEIVVQIEDSQIGLDSIVCPVGTGGTYAGLVAGKAYTEVPAQILGFNVLGESQDFRPKVRELLDEIGSILRKPVSISNADHEIIDGYVGGGYGITGSGDAQMIRDLAHREGLLLDPTYTAKAFYGMVDRILKKDPRLGNRILFLHTGGVFGLFPKWWRIAPSHLGAGA